MNVWLSKMFWLMMIDSGLTAMDYVEVYKTGTIEDYIDEPYEFEEQEMKYIIKEIITR